MPIDSMNKVIHAAVRRDLARLEGALAGVSDGDQRRARSLHRAWKQLAHQLRHHHTQEDTILFPVFVHLGVDRGLVEALEAEHAAMAQALLDIDSAMSSYAASGSAVDAADAAEVVRRGRPVVDQHLAHEEADLEPAVAGFAAEPELVQAMKQLRAQPPRRAGWFFAWLEDGAGPEERAYLATTVPGPVRMVLGRGFGRGYHRSIASTWR